MIAAASDRRQPQPHRGRRRSRVLATDLRTWLPVSVASRSPLSVGDRSGSSRGVLAASKALDICRPVPSRQKRRRGLVTLLIQGPGLGGGDPEVQDADLGRVHANGRALTRGSLRYPWSRPTSMAAITSCSRCTPPGTGKAKSGTTLSSPAGRLGSRVTPKVGQRGALPSVRSRESMGKFDRSPPSTSVEVTFVLA